MGTRTSEEIERKFLIDPGVVSPHLPAPLVEESALHIEQGYLAVDDEHEVRLRRIRAQSGLEYRQTAKIGKGLVRRECEVRVEAAFFSAFWPMTEGRRIAKQRWEFWQLFPGACFLVDKYLERLSGLHIVELEFPSAGEALSFSPPPWLGREVTNDQRYSARWLAVKGEVPPFN